MGDDDSDGPGVKDGRQELALLGCDPNKCRCIRCPRRDQDPVQIVQADRSVLHVDHHEVPWSTGDFGNPRVCEHDHGAHDHLTRGNDIDKVGSFGRDHDVIR